MERECVVAVVGRGAAGPTAGISARLAAASIGNLAATPAERGVSPVFAGGALMVPLPELATLALNPTMPREEIDQYVLGPNSEQAWGWDITTLQEVHH